MTSKPATQPYRILALVAMVKREILKGTDKVIRESDPEFAKILELFTRFS